MQREYTEEFQNTFKESGYDYSDQYLYSLIATLKARIDSLEQRLGDNK